MIPEIGLFSLILALAFAVLQVILPVTGQVTRMPSYFSLARNAASAQMIFVVLSFLILVYSFIVNDFSLTYVAKNSSLSLPLRYRWCAVWGAHEGSILLWVTILSLWTGAVANFTRQLPEKFIAVALSILGMISIGFILFILFTSNPFARQLVNLTTQGHDLNPLLQDPGFLIHPPMLYMGYVGFAVTFAFAMSALLLNENQKKWTTWVRSWTLTAWCFLTFGITLGSWWAYRDLGWGGWWFWDPVENASLMPWLVGTALIHSLSVSIKRGAFNAWTTLLAIFAFALSLLGTFLVRSGVLTSVHAFAVDPGRGIYMLLFLSLVVGSSLSLFAWRGNQFKSQGQFSVISRETFLLSNNVILFVIMSTVLLGTLYPLIIDALGFGKLSVGAPYFNAVIVPLLVPLFILLGFGPHSNWQTMQWGDLFSRIRWSIVFAILAAVLIPYVFASHMSWLLVSMLSLGFWIVFSTAAYLQRIIRQHSVKMITVRQWAMVIAHLGVAVCIIGVACHSTYRIERDVRMKLGETVQLGSYQIKFSHLSEVNGENYNAIRGEFILHEGEQFISRIQSEKRVYRVSQMPLTHAGIDASLFRDVYIALGEQLNNSAWAVRLYYKPFIRWVWGGGLLILIGGLLALCDRRNKKGRT